MKQAFIIETTSRLTPQEIHGCIDDGFGKELCKGVQEVKMGVKSTITLTRKDAERKFVYLKQEIGKKQLEREASIYSDKNLERTLEQLNDFNHDSGEGFENYLIID